MEVKGTLLGIIIVCTVCFITTTLLIHSKELSLETNQFLAPKLTRIIAIGDLHGDFQALQSILEFSNYKSNDVLVQTGDTVDKGTDTLLLFDYFIENQSPNIVHLMGNHEDMNLRNNLNYVPQGDFDSFGGKQNRKAEFSPSGKYGHYIRRRNITHKIGDVVFVHGGITPEIAEQFKTLESINSADRNSSVVFKKEGPLWYRGYARKSEAEMCQNLWKALEILGAKHMVMGHTTFPEITTKCGSSGIFIDTGVSRFVEGQYSSLEILQQEGVTYKISALYQNHQDVKFDVSYS